jgi:hypothetical protein
VVVVLIFTNAKLLKTIINKIIKALLGKEYACAIEKGKAIAIANQTRNNAVKFSNLFKMEYKKNIFNQQINLSL